MGDPSEASPAHYMAVRPIVLLLSGLLLALGAGCESLSSSPVAPGARKSKAMSFPLGTWQTDQLHCDAGRCERWYEIQVEGDGVLKVDLYAPAGPGLPDCEMRLETLEGEQLPAKTRRVRTQRRLKHRVESDTYYLKVTSRGESREPIEFELHAELTQEAAKPRRTSRPSQTATPPARPKVPMARRPPPQPVTPDAPEVPETPEAPETAGTPPPEPPDALGPELGPALPPDEPPALTEEPEPAPEPRWIVAEVLDVEETGGRPSAVMIEAGEPDGVRAGMHGELVEGDVVIGEIEVVDVYPTGSRAKIVGALSGPVGFDTFSRIPVPPEEE